MNKEVAEVNMKYYIQERLRNGYFACVVAPPGKMRGSNGEIIKCRDAVGPEWGKVTDVYFFNSHRAAARVRNLCGVAATIEATPC